MERKTFWILIAVAVGFGATMEILKRTAPSSLQSLKAEIALDEHFDSDSLLAHIESKVIPKIKQNLHIISRQMHNIGHRIESAMHPPDLAAATPAKVAQNQPDPKAKAKKDKEDKEKKDKEKKEKEKQQAEATQKAQAQAAADAAAAAQAAQAMADAAAKAAADQAAALAASGAYAPPPPAAGIQNGVPRRNAPGASADDWEERIAANPTAAEIAILVKEYKAGQVTQTVFYQVVQWLVGSSNLSYHPLGYLALSATPSEPSFAALTNLSASSTASAQDKQMAQSDLSAYGSNSASYVQILAAALQAQNAPGVNLEAMTILNTSAPNNFQSGSGNGGGGIQGQGVGPSPALLQAYENILNLLNRLANTYASPQLKQSAYATEQTLQALLQSQGYNVSLQ